MVIHIFDVVGCSLGEAHRAIPGAYCQLRTAFCILTTTGPNLVDTPVPNQLSMKSKASFKSHPIHPMLVALPIAFFSGTLIFDILTLLNVGQFNSTARHLTIAGLIGGVMAAIPGIIDFIYTVPPKSSGKKRAARHGMTNVAMMLLFGAALYYRINTENFSLNILLIIEVIAMTLLGFAGWMGGTLVYRNQIGVDPRYANAGKWKEVYSEIQNNRIVLDTQDDLETNQMQLIHASGRRFVLARSEKGLVAFDDRCPHRGGSLAGGSMMCGTVQCPWHGSQFEVTSGALKAGPSKEGIRSYEVKVENGKVVIVVE